MQDFMNNFLNTVFLLRWTLNPSFNDSPQWNLFCMEPSWTIRNSYLLALSLCLYICVFKDPGKIQPPTSLSYLCRVTQSACFRRRPLWSGSPLPSALPYPFLTSQTLWNSHCSLWINKLNCTICHTELHFSLAGLAAQCNHCLLGAYHSSGWSFCKLPSPGSH